MPGSECWISLPPGWSEHVFDIAHIIPSMRLPGREIARLLGAAVPGDHARQALADSYIDQEVGRVEGERWRVLDLGCGEGGSIDFFKARDPAVDWIGLDIPDSPEVNARVRTDARFQSFDGVNIPFEDQRFHLVYCKQVLEHVRQPQPLLSEVARVLAPGGLLAGSTSQLEPFHSCSTWNYTPFGLKLLLEQAGLTLVEVRPGIDAIALIGRRMLPSSPFTDRLWARWWAGQSPLHRSIDLYGRLLRLDARAVNATKLIFCGQFAFLAQRSA